MYKKNSFVMLLFTVRLCSTMETTEINLPVPLPTLTELCADVVAQQIAKNIEHNEDISWIRRPSHEARHIISCALIKYCSSLFWKHRNKKFSIQTVTPKTEAYHNYKQMLALTKAEIKKPDNGYLEILSPDSSFVISTHPYEDKDCNIKHAAEVIDNDRITHTLKSFWFPWVSFINVISRAEIIDSLQITPDSKFIVIKYILGRVGVGYRWNNEEIAIWNANTSSLVCNLYKKKPYCDLQCKLLINAFAISNDSSILAIGYGDYCRECQSCHGNPRSFEGYIDVFEISTGKLLHSFNALDLQSKNARITALVISTNNQCIIIGYDNNTIKTLSLDMATIDLIEVLNIHSSSCLFPEASCFIS